MRRSRLTTLLAALLLALTFATGTKADTGTRVSTDCSFLAYTTAYTGYVYQDFGKWGDHKPVLQSGITTTCGSWNVDVWNSSELSTTGRYGKRGGGDEGDLTVYYSDTVQTSLGPISYQFGGAYYALGYGKDGLDASKDDTAYGYLQVGRSFAVGTTTLTPFVRPSIYQHMSNQSPDYVLRYGICFDVPLAEHFSLRGDVTAASIFNQHRTVFRPTIWLAASLGNGWEIDAGLKTTNDTGPAWYVGLNKAF